MFLAEVDQKAESKTGKIQIREKLLCMDRRKLLCGFKLHEHEIIDEQVGAKTNLEDSFLVPEWDSCLGYRLEAGFSQFVSEHDFID